MATALDLLAAKKNVSVIGKDVPMDAAPSVDRLELIKKRHKMLLNDVDIDEVDDEPVQMEDDVVDDEVVDVLLGLSSESGEDYVSPIPVERKENVVEMPITEGLREQAARLGVSLVWCEEDGANPDMELFGSEKTAEELICHMEMEREKKKCDEEFAESHIQWLCEWAAVDLGGFKQYMAMWGIDITGMDLSDARKLLYQTKAGLLGWDEQHEDESYKQSKVFNIGSVSGVVAAEARMTSED